MKLFKFLIATGLAFAASTSLAVTETRCIKDLSPSLRKPVSCDGQSYNLTVSEECAEGGCGVIIDVHGLNMDPWLEDQNTGLSVSAPPYGYIVVQPSAPGRSWQEAHYLKVYDFYSQVKTAFDADLNRLHMTGFSQGSMMTLWFMCVFRDEFASYAPTAAAGGRVCEGVPGGIPDVPILYQHGWYDNLAGWNLAEDFYNLVLSQRNYEMVLDIGDRYSHRTEWVSDTGTRFALLSHGYQTSYWYGAGHCFPGAPYRNAHSCRGYHAYSWGDELLRFFIENPKREENAH